MDEETVALGGNIELTGFKALDGASMIVVKKIVGSYARRFSDSMKAFERLRVTLKAVHEREASKVYELHSHLLADGSQRNSSCEDRNLFFALDNVLKKLEVEAGVK